MGVVGDRAYTAEGMYKFAEMDISRTDTDKPVRAGNKMEGGYAFTLTSMGDVVVVSNYMGGIEVLDPTGKYPVKPLTAREKEDRATAPPSPISILWTGPKKVVGIAHEGPLAFLSLYTGGLQVLDLADPSEPRLRGKTSLGGYQFGIDVRDGLAAVAGHQQGLFLIDVGDPDAPRKLGLVKTRGEAYGVALTERYAYVADGSAGLTVLDLADRAAPELVAP